MDRSKCHQCGLVNWQGASECARCKSPLTAGMSSGENFENETQAAASGFSPARLGIMLLIIGCVGIGAYQVLKPAATPPPPKVVQMDTSPEKINQLLMQAQPDELKRQAQMREGWKGLEPPKFNKELLQKSIKAPNTQKL